MRGLSDIWETLSPLGVIIRYWAEVLGVIFEFCLQLLSCTAEPRLEKAFGTIHTWKVPGIGQAHMVVTTAEDRALPLGSSPPHQMG